MIRDITIGQYYPAKSAVHKLDARLKLIATIIFVITIFFAANIYGYIIVVLGLGAAIKISKVPVKFMLKGLKTIFVIIIFTVVINIFTTKGGAEILHIGGVVIYEKGLLLAFMMAARLVLLIIGSSLLTLTTTPIQLTDAIEYLLKPFKKIGVPSHEIAMMMTIALRFIPTLIEETDKIMKAQMARGADFDTGGIIKKAKSLIPLLVPLFISSFRRADELSTAMEARCYRGDINRTRMKQLKYARIDAYAAAFVVLYSAVLITSRWF